MAEENRTCGLGEIRQGIRKLGGVEIKDQRPSHDARKMMRPSAKKCAEKKPRKTALRFHSNNLISIVSEREEEAQA
jgi:hypothetical protein